MTTGLVCARPKELTIRRSLLIGAIAVLMTAGTEPSMAASSCPAPASSAYATAIAAESGS
jgi:hypothetical protein